MQNTNVLRFPATQQPAPKPNDKKTKPKSVKVTLELGINPETGKRQQKEFTAKNKKQAIAKREQWKLEQARLTAEAQERAETGASRAEREQPLSAWIDKWLLAYNTTGGYSTSESIERDAMKLQRFLGDMRLCDVRQIDIQRFAASIADKSKSTVLKAKSTTNRIFRAAITNYLMHVDPCTDVQWAHVGQGTHRFLDEWEIQTIVNHAQAYRVGIWAMLMLFGGLRRGEALALNWSDVDFDAGIIHVNKGLHFESNATVIGSTKTKSSVRDVPILPPLRAALLTAMPDEEALKQRGNDLICTSAAGQCVTRSVWNRSWTAYLNTMSNILNADTNTAVSPGRRSDKDEKLRPNRITFAIRAHDLRHTYASILYDAGVDIKTAQKLLGHTNATTTMEIYTHLSESKQTASIDKMIAHVEKYSLPSNSPQIPANDQNNDQ